MSENTNKLVVRSHFRRQIQPKQYETAEFAAYVEEEFPAGASPEEVEKVLKLQAQLVKVHVYDQLGLFYDQDETTKVIQEVFPASQKVAHLPAPAPATEPSPALEQASGSDVSAPTPKPTGKLRAVPTDDPRADMTNPWAHIMEHPEDWFCNVQDKANGTGNPKGPDFKNKSGRFKQAGTKYSLGLWLTDKTIPDWFDAPVTGYANDA